MSISESYYVKINNTRSSKRQTVMVYLKNLEDAGVLESVKAGREVLFVNKKFLNNLY